MFWLTWMFVFKFWHLVVFTSKSPVALLVLYTVCCPLVYFLIYLWECCWMLERRWLISPWNFSGSRSNSDSSHLVQSLGCDSSSDLQKFGGLEPLRDSGFESTALCFLQSFCSDRLWSIDQITSPAMSFDPFFQYALQCSSYVFLLLICRFRFSPKSFSFHRFLSVRTC